MKIKYRTNPRKLLETLVWVASKRPGRGFHFILKCLFYADKLHLQSYGRPITGDVYVKMPHGPVASLAYDMLKGNDFLDEEMTREVQAALAVTREGTVPRVTARRSFDQDVFSGTDLECLERGLTLCDGKAFSGLSDQTHEERAWVEAEMNQEMDFALFIDEDVPNREDLLEYIRETAACLAM